MFWVEPVEVRAKLYFRRRTIKGLDGPNLIFSVEVFLHLGFRTSCKACDNISLVLFEGFFSAFDIHMKLTYG